MWTLVYNREANTYALDSYPYNEDVLVAIELLSTSQNGLPTKNYRELATEYYRWDVAQHTVIFHRIPDKLEIRILVIKPES